MPPSSLCQSFTPSYSGDSSPSSSALFAGLSSFSAGSTCMDRGRDRPSTPTSNSNSSSPERTWSAEGSPVESMTSNESDEYGSDDDKPPFAVHPATPDQPRPLSTSPTKSILTSSSSSSSSGLIRPSRPQQQPISTRLRPRGLSPFTTALLPAPPSLPGQSQLQLPKSQPLSRALFSRLANDVPHAGTGAGGNSGGKKKGSAAQKLIVPTKAFKTTFELDLSANELARRA